MLDFRILTLASCLILSLSTLLAQPFEALIPLGQRLNESSEVSIFSDENGGLLFVQENETGLVLLLDDELKVKSQFRVDNLPPERTHQHLGYTYKDGHLFLAYLNQETQAYEVLSIFSDSEGTQFSTVDMSRLDGGSVFWGTFTYEGILHIVRLPRGKSSIRLCRFEGGEEFDAKEFPVVQEHFLENLRTNLTRIDEENPPEMETTYLPGKLYHFEDQLYLTLDDQHETQVVHINLKTGQKNEFSLPSPAFQDSLAKSNSLIVENRLFQLGMDRDSFKLVISDLDKQEALHSYELSSGDNWDIQLWKAEKLTLTGNIIPFTSNEDFFEEVYQMPYLAIGAQTLADSMVEFQLGGVHPISTKGITGIILDQRFKKAYLPSFIQTHEENFPQSLPKLLVSNRFGPNLAEIKPNYMTFKWKGKPYFGYYDEEKGGFYLSR